MRARSSSCVCASFRAACRVQKKITFSKSEAAKAALATRQQVSRSARALRADVHALLTHVSLALYFLFELGNSLDVLTAAASRRRVDCIGC